MKKFLKIQTICGCLPPTFFAVGWSPGRSPCPSKVPGTVAFQCISVSIKFNVTPKLTTVYAAS